ncbi:MAG: serine/threonine protein kinase, partial [Candidatus Sumerlaeia bacterium]|nr:serine/threonine protein kinase [Candidatus Sumerlaeia bacterium]
YLRKDLFEEAKSDESRGRALDVSFRQEALATANLEHPNIIPVHEVGVDQDGRPLIAMKRIGGRCWQDILDQDFSLLPYSEYLSKHLPILIDVSQAVAFAHSRGIVHRDIKPAQVMVGEFGEVVLMDWGLSVLFNEELLIQHAPGSIERDIPTLSTASNPAGTLAFMAPEQTEKHAMGLGPHTDVYLLGGILYYILTGRTPHDPDSVSQAFNQARKGIVRPMQDSPFGNEIPPPLVFIATQAMAPEPEDRIPSALSFIEELQNYLTGASKREESRHLTASVLEQLSSDNLEYAELSDLLSQIAQARILDGQNEEAIGAEQVLRKRYTERALGNQDYVLAKIQALASTTTADGITSSKSQSRASDDFKSRTTTSA